MKYLALTLPGGQTINPVGVPQGGLHDAGAGIISIGIAIFLSIISIISLFYLIYGGFRWMASSGDREKLAQAKRTISYAIIGLVVSFTAIAIMNVISTFFKVDLLTF